MQRFRIIYCTKNVFKVLEALWSAPPPGEHRAARLHRVRVRPFGHTQEGLQRNEQAPAANATSPLSADDVNISIYDGTHSCGVRGFQ